MKGGTRGGAPLSQIDNDHFVAAAKRRAGPGRGLNSNTEPEHRRWFKGIRAGGPVREPLDLAACGGTRVSAEPGEAPG